MVIRYFLFLFFVVSVLFSLTIHTLFSARIYLVFRQSSGPSRKCFEVRCRSIVALVASDLRRAQLVAEFRRRYITTLLASPFPHPTPFPAKISSLHVRSIAELNESLQRCQRRVTVQMSSAIRNSARCGLNSNGGVKNLLGRQCHSTCTHDPERLSSSWGHCLHKCGKQ